MALCPHRVDSLRRIIGYLTRPSNFLSPCPGPRLSQPHILAALSFSISPYQVLWMAHSRRPIAVLTGPVWDLTGTMVTPIVC